MTIKPGERHESAVWLDADGKPLPHHVTKLARGHVGRELEEGEKT